MHGLRVDHPDGLADPGGYLDRLARGDRRSYVLVEKILEGARAAAASWRDRRHHRLRRARRLRPRARRPGRAGAARRARGAAPAGRRAGRSLGRAGPRRQARHRRRHPALRGAPAGAGCTPERSTGADATRSPSCSPASPCTAPTCRSASEHLSGCRRLPRARRPDLAAAIDAAAARARRPGASGRRALPADVRDGDGQGRRGHRVLPVQPATRSTRSAPTRRSSPSTSTSSTPPAAAPGRVARAR